MRRFLFLAVAVCLLCFSAVAAGQERGGGAQSGGGGEQPSDNAQQSGGGQESGTEPRKDDGQRSGTGQMAGGQMAGMQMAGMQMGPNEHMNMQPGTFLEEIAQHATSGTSAQPDSTPAPMLMAMRGAWTASRPSPWAPWQASQAGVAPGSDFAAGALANPALNATCTAAKSTEPNASTRWGRTPMLTPTPGGRDSSCTSPSRRRSPSRSARQACSWDSTRHFADSSKRRSRTHWERPRTASNG